MATNLDSIDFATYDPERIIDQLENFSEECKVALKHFDELVLPPDFKAVRRVVLVGMGGSGIANEMIKGLLHGSKLAIDSIHNYSLPAYVDSETLVIISSYSGNTEEPVAAMKEAQAMGAKMIAVTSGGQVASLADEFGALLLTFSYNSMPRMALPYLFGSLLCIFTKLGYLTDISDYEVVLDRVAALTEKFHYAVPAEDNLAKIIAEKLIGKVPVVYASPLTFPLGLRLKDQFNENAKTLAVLDQFPELNHNAIEGYLYPKIPFHFLFLESSFDSSRIGLRQEITASILEQNGFGYDRIRLSGCDNLLVEYFSLALFSDYVSYYLAMANEVNPTMIPNINYLKNRL